MDPRSGSGTQHRGIQTCPASVLQRSRGCLDWRSLGLAELINDLTHTHAHTHILYIFIYIYIHILIYMLPVHVCRYTYIHIYIHTYLHTYLPTYLHTYIPTYLHTYIPTYLHTYIHTYIHTYTHTYIHIETRTKYKQPNGKTNGPLVTHSLAVAAIVACEPYRCPVVCLGVQAFLKGKTPGQIGDRLWVCFTIWCWYPPVIEQGNWRCPI